MLVDETRSWGLTEARSKLPQMEVDRRPPPTKLLLDVAVLVSLSLGLVVEAAVEVVVVSFLMASSLVISELLCLGDPSAPFPFNESDRVRVAVVVVVSMVLSLLSKISLENVGARAAAAARSRANRSSVRLRASALDSRLFCCPADSNVRRINNGAGSFD